MEFDNTDKKKIIKLEGGHDMVDLFKHVGKVNDENTYEAAMQKIRKALRGRGNRTAAVFKLFTGIPQGQKTLDAWHKVYEAAMQVEWDGYDAETPAVDAIVMRQGVPSSCRRPFRTTHPTRSWSRWGLVMSRPR